jgi:hypothetical protein
MDAHFNEYLAAVAGMAEVYGDWSDEPHVLPCDAAPNLGPPEALAMQGR